MTPRDCGDAEKSQSKKFSLFGHLRLAGMHPTKLLSRQLNIFLFNCCAPMDTSTFPISAMLINLPPRTESVPYFRMAL